MRSGRGPGSRGRHVFLLTLAAFFVYTGLEIATGQWAYSLLTEQRGTGTTAAGLWVATYWAALTGGRLAMAVGSRRGGAVGVLGGASVGAVAGTALLWLDPAGVGALGLPLVGLSLAPVFPTLVSLTPVRLGNERAASAIGYQLTAAGIGAAGPARRRGPRPSTPAASTPSARRSSPWPSSCSPSTTPRGRRPADDRRRRAMSGRGRAGAS
jgi:hypothetical protein